MQIILSAVVLVLYAIATILIWRQDFARRKFNFGSAKITNHKITDGKITDGKIINLLILLIIVLHGWLLSRLMFNFSVVDLALGYAVSAVAFMTLFLFYVAIFFQQITAIGIIVLPLCAAGFLIGWLFPGLSLLSTQLPKGVGGHVFIALPAYGVLCIAFAQSLILGLQERQLRKPQVHNFFDSLPAVQTLERNLFKLIFLGFVLLSINLIIGMAVARQNFGAILLFNHHVLFSLMAWGGVGALLMGRKFLGWRGRVATLWTVVVFVFLMVGYFGTRFVSEVILGRV